MKKGIVTILLFVGLAIAPTQKTHAIWWWVAKAAIKKAILAADLAIQRQQNKVIWLQNAQKTIENTMSKLKLDQISDWTEKQRSLYKGYFEELSKVKSIITYYKRIKEISQKQVQLVQEYKRVWSMIRTDHNFSVDELEHIGNIYQGILNETVNNLDQLYLVINSFSTTMSDAKRLEIIGNVADKVDQNYSDLLKFNQQNYMLSLSRTKSQIQIDQIRILYGIK